MSGDSRPAAGAGAGEQRAAEEPVSATYERPRIVWTEPYEPMTFGLSCAKVLGDADCMANGAKD